MSNQYPEQRRTQRPDSREMARRRAARAERERQRKARRNRNIALIVALALLIAIVVVIVVACSGKKKEPTGSSAQTAATTSSKVDKSMIPAEYVPATITHDDIAITDDAPIQGTDTNCSIRVNTALNLTTFYDASGNPVKAFSCSTGRRDGHETPEGTFTMGEWIVLPMSEWCYMADGTEGLYAYRIIDGINNDIMFHSVPYFEADHGTLEYEEYNKLGDYASMGCIRMACQDVRWLGEHCGTGTEVTIYYDPSEQPPLNPAAPIRIPDQLEQLRGWDPTDPVSANPWHSYTIDLQVPNSITVQYQADYETDPILAEAKATDNYGNDVSGHITYSGVIDNMTKGVYTVRVSCDVGPSHAYKDVYVIVE